MLHVVSPRRPSPGRPQRTAEVVNISLTVANLWPVYLSMTRIPVNFHCDNSSMA